MRLVRIDIETAWVKEDALENSIVCGNVNEESRLFILYYLN